MELSSSAIRTQSFPLARRGYDPEAVDGYLAGIAAAVAEMEAELLQAREAEEAVKLTFVAAAQTKQDMIDEARASAEAMIESAREETATARKEAQMIRHKAQQNAEETTATARSEALALIAATRADAEALARQIQDDHRKAVDRVESVTAIVHRTREQLAGLARDAVLGLDAAAEVLDGERQALGEITVPEIEPADAVVVAPEAVAAPDALAAGDVGEQVDQDGPPSAPPVEHSGDDGHAHSLLLPETAEAARTVDPVVQAAAPADGHRQGELLAALQSLTRG